MKYFYLLILLCCISPSLKGQTIALSPTGNGGFESGTSFSSNGWTEVQNTSISRRWFVGTAAGSVGGSMSAYIGTSSSFGGTTSTARQHFYRDIAIPAGATNLTLSFYLMQTSVDGGSDYLRVYVGSSTNPTPTAGNTPSGYTQVFSNTWTSYSSFTAMSAISLSGYAGTTMRIIFTYDCDGSSPAMAAAIDNISITYCALPSITGTSSACTSASSALSIAATGGTWSSSSTSVATVNSSGNVTGVSGGTATISYTAGSCVSTRVFTVTNTPAAIGGGTAPICEGGTAALTNSVAGGTWTSSITSVATVSSTGVVTGASAGTAVITYSNGCGTPPTKTVTVNAMPSSITGPSIVCTGTSPTFSSAPAGGAWSSSAASVATINSSTGVLNPLAEGTTTVSYNLAGCVSVTTVNTKSAPSAIGFLPSASGTLCLGGSATFTATATAPLETIISQDFNSGLAGWVISNTAGNSNSYWQIRNPPGYGSSGVNGDGSPYIQAAPDATSNSTNTIFTSPSFSTVGYTSAALSYNQEFRSYFNDATVACQYSINGGSTWTTLVNQLGSSDLSYTWTVATPQVSVALPAAALGQANVKVRWSYNSNSGYWWAVDNIKVRGIPVLSFNWGGVAGATGLSCATCSASTITPAATGANVYSVSTTANGCTSTGLATLNVNALPAPINGATAPLCVGSAISLTNSTMGGTWISNNPAIAGIDAATGEVTGVSAGTATISYLLSGSCAVSTTLNVNPAPSAITGTLQICEGATTSLTQAVSGGTWSSGSSAVSIGPSTGIAIGNSSGIAAITYTLPSGCSATAEITVNQLPATITGVASVCESATAFLASSPASGVWSSADATIAAMDAGSGEMTGMSAGTTMVTYSLATGCYRVQEVTVNALPADIAGTLAVCEGAATSLSSATPGGVWSSDAASVADVSMTGVVSGYAAGSANISYVLANGCYQTANVVVNQLPGTITGVQQVCEGLTTVLNSAPSGGDWSSDNTSVATVVTGTGDVSGILAGTANVMYTLSTGCSRAIVVTVNTQPSAIVGATSVCEGTTVVLSNATTGGTWSSDATSVADIDVAGILTGYTSGSVNVSYVLGNGCYATTEVMVNSVPGMITGISQVCEGLATILTSSAIDGDWTSDNASVATVDVGTGEVFAVSAGTANVMYTLSTGCSRAVVVTVNALPSDITGAFAVCEGLTTMLSNATPGGTWTSDAASIAGIDLTGLVSGNSSGNANITYTLANGCYKSVPFAVSSLPDAFTGTHDVCEGLTTALASAPVGGNWTSDNTAVATVDATTGLVHGVGAGTSYITYALAGGCSRTGIVTVNGLPGDISGILSVCEGMTTNLYSTTSGGSWYTSSPTAWIDPASGVATAISAGVATMTYMLPTGCAATADIMIKQQPAPITGALDVCEGALTMVGSWPVGGSWTSNNPSIATVVASGDVTGMSAGTAEISYTLAEGCTSTAIVSVNPGPSDITGMLSVCEGLSTILSSATPGGSWSSDNTAAALIDGSGVVTGVSGGAAEIMYTMPTGCYKIANVVVNELPAPITGDATICESSYGLVVSSPDEGTWSSGSTGIVTVDAVTGGILGVSAGTSVVTYTLPTGCFTTNSIVVNSLPSDIAGTLQACEGLTTGLSNVTPGGVWSVDGTSVAEIDASGVVAGVAEGTAGITYTASNGCYRSAVFTVNPLPDDIFGDLQVCEGASTLLSSGTPGGSFSAGAPVSASVSTTGVVMGITAGLETITYTLPTGCMKTVDVAVSAGPADIIGSANVCEGQVTNLTNATADGAWSIDNTSIAQIDESGSVTGIATGTTLVSYVAPFTGCAKTAVVTVNPIPADISGSLEVCAGMTTALTNTTPGGSWSTLSLPFGSVNASGVVTGNVAGNMVVVYTLPSGCSTTAVVAVNPQPAPITGTLEVCEGASTHLFNATDGGWWTSSATNVNVNSSGEAYGLAAGNATVTYMLGSGCMRMANVSVNPMPSDIFGATQVCQGSTTSLSNSVTGGIWFVSNASVAGISASGVATGVTAGTVNIMYSLPTGCFKTTSLVVDPLPGMITGAAEVCEGSTITMGNASPSGYWDGGDGLAFVDIITGEITGVNAGVANLSYVLPTGCMRVSTVTVNPLPGDISGTLEVCEGANVLLVNSTSGGAWASDNMPVAAIDATGNMTGVLQGTANALYTLPTGCSRVVNVVVNPLPDMITGAAEVCEGSTITLDNTSPSGYWDGGDANAIVDMFTGEVAGASAGVANISYVLPTGCMRVSLLTVNPLPADITGTLELCEGANALLANATSGGAWASDNMPVADVDATGNMTGVLQGTANVVYTLPTGCSKVAGVVVNPLPSSIVGTMKVCEGGVTGLGNLDPDGSWTSAAPGIAEVDMLSGSVNGIAAGTATVSYQLSTGCSTSAIVTVDPLPAAITGTFQVCEGLAATLANATAGGSWSSENASVATIDASGVTTGMVPGTAKMVYTLPTGCMSSTEVLVNALPDEHNVTGGGAYCAGTSGVAIGGDGSETGVDYQLYNGTSPVGMPLSGSGTTVDFGLQTAPGAYSVVAINAATGCVRNMTGAATVTITPLNIPSVTVTSDLGTAVCAGTVVNYTATPVNGGTLPAYAWEVNGMMVTGVTSSTYSYVPSNGDVVKAILNSNAVCAIPSVATDMLLMTVATGATPAAVISVPGGITSVCEGSNITLSASSTFGGTSPVYEWLKNGVLTGSTGPLYTYVPANGDVIACKLTSSYACLSHPTATSNELVMATDPVYIPIISISVAPGTDVPAGTPVTYTAIIGTTGGPAPSYQWYVNGAIVPGATSGVYTTSTLSNNDSVICKVSASGPCGFESFNSVLMRVRPTGIDQLSGVAGNIIMVPNPNKGDFTIKGHLLSTSDEELRIEVVNLLGQIVYKAQVTAKAGDINERIQLGDNLANGMYMLNLRTGDETSVIHFVLEK